MNKSQKGFTLAELLIALALLGVIAAFTIPKVLQASGTAENLAKAKEAASTLEQAWYNQKLQNQFTAGSPLYASIQPILNTTAAGTGEYTIDYASRPAGTPASPCDSTNGALGGTDFQGYVKFANGVVISGLQNGGGNGVASTITSDLSQDPNAAGVATYLICVDLNGESNGPNTVGTDVFFLNFNAYGDFNYAGLPATASGNAKNFYYGSGNGTNPVAGPGTAAAWASDATGTGDLAVLLNQGS